MAILKSELRETIKKTMSDHGLTDEDLTEDLVDRILVDNPDECYDDEDEEAVLGDD